MRCWATHLLGIAVSGAVALPIWRSRRKHFASVSYRPRDHHRRRRSMASLRDCVPRFDAQLPREYYI
jgi:hypothetical protein